MNFVISTKLEGCEDNRYLIANEIVLEGHPIWINTIEYSTLGTGKATLEEINSWSFERQEIFKKHCWAIDWNLFVGCITDDPTKDLTNYINHSCDPSCWFQGDNCIVARRDLSIGDRITIEYATVDHQFVEFDNECDCKSLNMMNYLESVSIKRRDD
jgi:hypothetical protein